LQKTFGCSRQGNIPGNASRNSETGALRHTENLFFSRNFGIHDLDICNVPEMLESMFGSYRKTVGYSKKSKIIHVFGSHRDTLHVPKYLFE
jgi:hypothetical protein